MLLKFSDNLEVAELYFDKTRDGTPLHTIEISDNVILEF